MPKDDRTRRERIAEALIHLAVKVNSGFSRLLRPGSLVVLVAVTLAGIGVLLKEGELPNDSLWQPGEPAAVALVVIGAIAYLGYLLVVVGYRRSLKRSDQDARLYKTCRDVAALVERTTVLSRDAIGVHIWTVRGLRGVRRLERRATFVPGERQPTAITWRMGKGVLGQCWARDQWILADLEPLANASDEEAFYAIPREERFFFTWQEARSTAHYRAVLAWPLRGGPENARRVVGVLSVDVQSPGAYAELDKTWTQNRADFSAHLAVCEAVLSGD